MLSKLILRIAASALVAALAIVYLGQTSPFARTSEAQAVRLGSQEYGFVERDQAYPQVSDPYLRQALHEMTLLVGDYRPPGLASELGRMQEMEVNEICLAARKLFFQFCRFQVRYGEAPAWDPATVDPVREALWAALEKLAWIKQRGIAQGSDLNTAFDSIASKYVQLQSRPIVRTDQLDLDEIADQVEQLVAELIA